MGKNLRRMFKILMRKCIVKNWVIYYTGFLGRKLLNWQCICPDMGKSTTKFFGHLLWGNLSRVFKSLQ